MVAVDRTHLSRPLSVQHEVALRLRFEELALVVHDRGPDAGSGSVAEPGLSGVAPGSGDQDSARLGLPPRVDDRAAAVADDAVIPLPRLGIDRLADRSEQPERLAERSSSPAHRPRASARGSPSAPCRRSLTPACPRRPRSGPDPASSVPPRTSASSRRSRAARRRRRNVPVTQPTSAVHQNTSPGAKVEDASCVNADVDEIAAGRVQHALGLAGGTRGVEDEQRVFRVHASQGQSELASRSRSCHQRSRPAVMATVAAGAADDDHRPTS